MTYATLLVHLQSGQSNTALLTIAGQFAERFSAHVIGIAACQPMVIVGGEGYVCGDVFENDQRQISADLEAAQAEFRNALRGKSTRLEWRSTITIAALSDYLSIEARSADLIMTARVPADTFNLSRTANPGSLVMQVGRPVLIVPAATEPMKFERAVIGWKDTRETRRATLDALPLLKQTARVTVLEIAAADELDVASARVKDVVMWLARHGVMAESQVELSKGDDIGQLYAMTEEEHADAIVAGAYGHSRLREWVVGGVTRDLLLGSKHCVLVSH